MTQDIYNIVDQWPFDPSLLKVPTTTQEGVTFQESTEFIIIVVRAAITEEKFDFKTRKELNTIIGTVSASKIPGRIFASQIVTFSGTGVMVFFQQKEPGSAH